MVHNEVLYPRGGAQRSVTNPADWHTNRTDFITSTADAGGKNVVYTTLHSRIILEVIYCCKKRLSFRHSRYYSFSIIPAFREAVSYVWKEGAQMPGWDKVSHHVWPFWWFFVKAIERGETDLSDRNWQWWFFRASNVDNLWAGRLGECWITSDFH